MLSHGAGESTNAGGRIRRIVEQLKGETDFWPTLIRNSMRYASWKGCKAIAAHLRPIHLAEIALAPSPAASDVGKSSPAVVDAWRRAWNEFVPFFDKPA